MGWFLSSSKPKKKKKRGKKSKPAWDPRRTLAGLKVLGAIAGIVAVAALWRAGEVALVGYAKEHRALPITPARVELVGAPAWIEGKLGDQMKQRVAERVQADPFDGRALTDAAMVMLMNPWVASVDQVRRTPAGVVVEATYRQPLAMVQARDGFHVIDTQGVRLSGPAYWQALEPSGLPMITNVSVAPPPELGMPWEGAEIEAGVELVKLLRDEPYAGQITAYDVGQRDPRTGKLCLVLQTDEGGVVWGRPPGDAWAVAEVSTSEKVDRLRRLAETYLGRIDAGGRVVWIHGQQVQTDDRPTRPKPPAIAPSSRDTDGTVQHAAGR